VAGAADDPAAVVDVGLDGTVTNVTYSYSIEFHSVAAGL
jgi:hypothetical protein